MKTNLKYITYQSFPSAKANTIQTVDNVNYLSKYFQVELIFPLREKESSDNIDDFIYFYDIKENVKVRGVDHKYPFGKIKYFEKLFFLISHFLWAKNYVKNIDDSINDNFFTRSDWIFYFLSQKNKNVTFECHQLSKIRKFVMKQSINKSNSKIIFLNDLLMEDSKLNLIKHKNKLTVLHNGVDENLFTENIKKDKNKVIFIGNLKRFNKSRNLEFFISAFRKSNMPNNLTFTIIGHPQEEIEKLKKFVKRNKLEKKIKLINRLERRSAIAEIQKANIGLLINTDNNLHSTHYTSPLKYFEYLYAGLKIVAANFPSHHALPFSENVIFYEINDDNSFINGLMKASKSQNLKVNNIEQITLKNRAKRIFEFIN